MQCLHINGGVEGKVAGPYDIDGLFLSQAKLLVGGSGFDKHGLTAAQDGDVTSHARPPAGQEQENRVFAVRKGPGGCVLC